MKATGGAVLVVDDDEDWRGVLAEVLADEGFVVTTAGDGRAALRSIRRATPDVVITDIEMPLMDGCKLFDGIRRIERGLPVIVMTGLDAPDEETSSHAFRVIRKPATTDAVLAAVRDALMRRKRTRAGRLWVIARRSMRAAADRRASTGTTRALGKGRIAVTAGIGALAAAALLVVTIRVATA